MTYEEFDFELRAWLSKETEMIRQTLPYSLETAKQKKQARKGIPSGVPRKGDVGLHPGFLSGRRSRGMGGFILEYHDGQFKIWIDPTKVWYAKYVEMPNKRTADFWNRLVVQRFKTDFLAFLRQFDPNMEVK